MARRSRTSPTPPGRPICAAATRAGSSAPGSTRPTWRWLSSISPGPWRTAKRPRRSTASASARSEARCSRSTRWGAGHEALERYRGFRTRLDEELGLEPGAQTRSLESAILRQRGRALTAPAAEAGRSSAARPADSPRLLGRRAELEELSHVDTRGARRPPGPAPGRRRSGRRQDAAARGAPARAARRRASAGSSASSLESHLPYVPLATALREALTDRERMGRRLPALGADPPRAPTLLAGKGVRRGRGARGPRRRTRRTGAAGAVDRRSPVGGLADDRGAGLPPAAGRRSAGCDRHRRQRAGDAPADHPLRGLELDVNVRLEPLTSAALAPLGMPGLHERTGGHPRFIQDELSRSHRATASSTLAGALVAQCRAEGPFAFRVLVAASLMPQPFEPEPVASLVGADPMTLTEELERLCARRILRVDRIGLPLPLRPRQTGCARQHLARAPPPHA